MSCQKSRKLTPIGYEKPSLGVGPRNEAGFRTVLNRFHITSRPVRWCWLPTSGVSIPVLSNLVDVYGLKEITE